MRLTRSVCRTHADTVHAALELCFPPEPTLPLLCLQLWRSPAVASLFLAWSLAEVRWRVRVARPSPFHGRLPSDAFSRLHPASMHRSCTAALQKVKHTLRKGKREKRRETGVRR